MLENLVPGFLDLPEREDFRVESVESVLSKKDSRGTYVRMTVPLPRRSTVSNVGGCQYHSMVPPPGPLRGALRWHCGGPIPVDTITVVKNNVIAYQVS